MKNTWSELIKAKYYRPEEHPFKIFENRIGSRMRNDSTVVDAGCGSSAPLLQNFIDVAGELIGVDLVTFDPNLEKKGLSLLNNDLSKMDIADSSADLVISRSVMEHLEDVESVYREIYRILRPGGHFIFLVPNLWDYVSVISYLIPNRYHKAIVSKLSGRAPKNVFPTYYRSNTDRSVRNLAGKTGYKVNYIEYYGQYPYMLEFNSLAFMVGVAYDKIVSKYRSLRCLRGWMLVELVK